MNAFQFVSAISLCIVLYQCKYPYVYFNVGDLVSKEFIQLAVSPLLSTEALATLKQFCIRLREASKTCTTHEDGGECACVRERELILYYILSAFYLSK